MVEQKTSQKETSDYTIIKLEIPGDITLGQAFAIKESLEGNAVFVNKQTKQVAGAILDTELTNKKLSLVVELTDENLIKHIDDLAYINDHYIQVDCLYYLLGRMH